MENNYWEKFYKKKHTMKHTAFANDSIKIIKNIFAENNVSIIDVMAGNGRDTVYLNSQSNFSCTGVDGAFESSFVKKESLHKTLQKNCCYDVVYSRFGLHCISYREIEKLIQWTQNIIAAEFRIKGDRAILYPDSKGHKRNYIDLGKIISFFINNDFEIKIMSVGRGLAKYKNEDPLVARIYAQRTTQINQKIL